MTTTCLYCREPVDPTARATWRRVHGWERKAVGVSRRSGSDIALREPGHEYAHDHCIRRLQAGVSPTQGALL